VTITPWDVDPQISDRYLLQCMVEAAKVAFRAQACSVFLVDDDTGGLVFEAVAGQGEDHLVGTRFQTGTGIAGWVLASAQPVIADDLQEAGFSQDAAERTGYVPRTIAAAPILYDGACVGVLEVLDRDSERDELETLELIALLSVQAAAGIALLRQVRRSAAQADARNAVEGENTVLLESIAAGLSHLDDDEGRLLTQVLAVAGGISRRAALRHAERRDR
jgi:GAF domain-containing protein